MYFCAACGARSHEQLQCCLACLAFSQYLPEVYLRQQTPTPPGNPVGADQLARRRATRTVVWGLGSVSEDPFLVAVWGPPGAGKTTFMLKVSADLARSRRVLYVAAEEGQGETLASKLRWLEIRSPDILIAPLLSCSSHALDWAHEHECSAVVLDSFSASRWSVVDLATCARELLTIFSLHVTKAETPAGSNAITHLADQVVHVDQGSAIVEKNRFGPSITTPVLEVTP